MMERFQSRPSTIWRQSGDLRAFSLIEVVIALAAATMLIATVYGLLSTFSKRVEQGERIAARSQLTQSLYQALQEDLRAMIVLEDANQSPEFESPNASPPSLPPVRNQRPFDSSAMSPLPSATSSQMVDLYFRGTAESIEFVRLAPEEWNLGASNDSSNTSERNNSSPRQVESTQKAPEQHDSLYLVSYRLDPPTPEEPGSLSRQESLIGNSATEDEDTGSTTSPFMRQDRVNRGNTSDMAGDDVDDSSNIVGWSESVSGFARARFRYFDGEVWQTEWDSRTALRPLHAIELSFDLAPLRNQKRLPARSGSSSRLDADSNRMLESQDVPDERRTEEANGDNYSEESEAQWFPQYRFVYSTVETLGSFGTESNDESVEFSP
jgi:type II secretory pathway pseudopilin PulG